MDVRNSSDRIWYNMINAERMHRYYSGQTKILKRRYSISSFLIIVLPILVLMIYQLDIQFSNWIIALLLLFISTCGAIVFHFGLARDASVCEIMANQSGKLSEQWRRLWLDQNRHDLESWIRFLEEQTNHLGINVVPYNKDLNNKAAKETLDEYVSQFG